MSKIKAVVGLGNPGSKYDQTRHNIGFRLLDEVASRAGVSFKDETKWESALCKIGEVVLIKPLTFMNESGRAVGSLSRFYRWKPEEILVVYDDVALPLGHLRFRMKGGHGGHNGIRSMLAHLASEAFPRLKLGIDAATGEKLVGHVLGKFSLEEREVVENTLARAAEAVQLAVSDSVHSAANEFNTRTPKKPKKPNILNEDESQVRGPDCPEHHGSGEERRRDGEQCG